MVDDHKGAGQQDLVADGDGSAVPGTPESVKIGQKRWRGERDDYRRGKRAILRGCMGWGPEFPEPSEAFHVRIPNARPTVCHAGMGFS
jgi:hypothetical protein